ncbi:MAG: S41 family peptidase [bacterium]|nr:S41 family peptidase [bacterium]
MQEFLKTNRVATLALLLVGFFLFGFSLGNHNKPEAKEIINLASKNTAVNTNADFSPFWKVWETIDEKFPDAEKTSDQERVYGAIDGLIGSLDDPHSVFFDPEETKRFEEDISGNFSGVGMELGMKNRVLTVISPLKDTPAYKAGIKSGDKILKIDGSSTTDINVEGAVKLIRGEAGTAVTITIFREGEKESRDIKIVRSIITIPTLDTEARSDGIFVIKLYSFSANSTDLFRKAIREFAKTKTNKLLLDLRGNPGGYLNAAVEISSWFVEGGKNIVIEDYGGDSQKPKIYRSRGYDLFNENLKFVILIDEGSASASEIVAGAMQDHKLAKIVGEKSYGKGSVQEVVQITSNTVFKVTVAKWLTPDGHLIDGKGLTPDFEVKFSPKDSDAGKDPQMDKALELLNNWK